LRQIADPPPHLERVADDVLAGDPRRPAGRQQVAGQDLHRRRLAGTVGAEEADDLATRDLERDALERHRGPEGPGETVDLDHREQFGSKGVAGAGASPAGPAAGAAAGPGAVRGGVAARRCRELSPRPGTTRGT